MIAIAVPEHAKKQTSRKRVHAAIGHLLPIVMLLVIWIACAFAFSSTRVIPTPGAVIEAFIRDAGVYPANISVTLRNAAIGFVAGNIAAVATALLFLLAPWSERILMRIAVMTFCVPLVAVTPILLVMFSGDLPKQILAGISVYFTTLVATLVGLRSVTPAQRDLISSMGGSSRTVLLKARLASMLPSLFAGLQIAAPAAILGTILGEYLGASEGLGVMLIRAQSSFEVASTWSTALVMAAVSGIAFAVFGGLGRIATPWVSKEVSTDVGQSIQAASTMRSGQTVLISLLGVLGSTVIVVGVWWGSMVFLGLSPYFAKTPIDVFQHLFVGSEASGNRNVIIDALAVTLRDAGIGYLAGTLLACVTAVGTVTSRSIERLVLPMALVLRSVPLVALTPLLALVFGRGLLGVTVIVSLVTFFPTLVNVAAALRAAPALACDVVISMGGTIGEVTRKVRLPYALPAVFASARIAIPGAFAGATLAEWLATGEGLGTLLVRDFAASRFDALWSATAVAALVAVGLYTLVSVIEPRLVSRFTASTFS